MFWSQSGVVKKKTGWLSLPSVNWLKSVSKEKEWKNERRGTKKAWVERKDEENVWVVRVSISTLISGYGKTWELAVLMYLIFKYFTLLSASHAPWFLVSLKTRSQRGEPPYAGFFFGGGRSELAAACSTVGSSRLCCLRLLLSPCQYLVAQVRWL